MTPIPAAKKLDLATPILLSSSEKSDRDIEILPHNVLTKRLRVKADKYISNARNSFKFPCFAFTVENEGGNLLQGTDSMLKVPDEYMKLFEGSYIKGVTSNIAYYVFNNIVGFDKYFNCPCIILRDIHGDVVDIIKYRPSRVGYENLPKYLQEKSQDKPKNRGNAFLYPFQAEMERIIRKEQYAILGEGIKNTLNALIRSIPFISIESTSNTNNPELLEYVNHLANSGVKILGGMDGDNAGRKAFTTMSAGLDNSIVNLFNFDGGLDFTNYIKMENQWD